MKVSDLMTPTVLVVDTSDTVSEAAKKMKEFDVGFLAVVSDYSVRGILTDRDIVVRGLAGDIDLNSCLVEDIATTNPVTCSADLPIEEAAQLFSQFQIHRILVVDDNSEPVGVLSLGDLASKMADDQFIGAMWNAAERFEIISL